MTTWQGGDRPIDGTDELVLWFEKACSAKHLIGTEQEKFGLYLDDAGVPTPVRYDTHVRPTLEAMRDRFGWKESATRGVDGELIALERDGASITLEPGGQLELSGAPLPTVHHTCAEFSTHYEELHAVAEPMGVAWIACGFHPFATRDEIDLMPKGRYDVMRAYLPTRGKLALDMMLRTCTVQANFDYESEAQCGRRLRLMFGISSLITALFANSPFKEGAPVPVAGDPSQGQGQGLMRSLRSATWEHVDPDRCGLLPWIFADGFSWERYVDWALDVPMFFVQRHHHYHAHHVPFRQYLREGWTGPDGVHHRATQADWELHLSTLFPEVRIKPFIEIRGADSVGSRTVCALPALSKGLIYDDDAREAAWELVADLSFDARLDLWRRARERGLSDAEVFAKCKRLLQLARGGLERLDVRDSKGRTEARFLDALDEQVERGATPAGDALRHFSPQWAPQWTEAAPGRSVEGRRALIEYFTFAGALGSS